MPSESAPPGYRSRTAKRRRAPTVDRRAERRDRGQQGERLVQRRPSAAAGAGRRPGSRPPSRPARRRWRPRAPRPSRVPEPRSVRVAASPRSSAWPPITPTSRRPATHSVSASSTAWSCSALAIEASRSWAVCDQAYARASRLSAYVGGVVEVLGPVEVVAVEVDRSAAAGRARRSRRGPRRGAASPGANRQPRNSAPATRRSRSSADRSLRSTARTRQPRSVVAPAASRWSKSASVSTWTPRPRLRLTWRTYRAHRAA